MASGMQTFTLGGKVNCSNAFPFDLFTQAVAVLVWVSRETAFKEET